jgi:predicted RNase H-like HicB family nuclease
MIELPYSLVIEATAEPDYFGFYSPDLEGFSGIGHSVEDCLFQAKWGMKEHVALLKAQGLPIPKPSLDPQIIVKNAARPAPNKSRGTRPRKTRLAAASSAR